MNKPTADDSAVGHGPERHTASSITDPELEALYDQLEQLRKGLWSPSLINRRLNTGDTK